MMQELLDAINRLNAALDQMEWDNAKRELEDACGLLEGLIPGFVSPFPSDD